MEEFDNGNHVDERRLMDRDIVFVSFNYRVEPFGKCTCNAKCFTSIRAIIYSRIKLNISLKYNYSFFYMSIFKYY